MSCLTSYVVMSYVQYKNTYLFEAMNKMNPRNYVNPVTVK